MQPICTVSPALYFARIAADFAAGIAQVSPATVIEPADSAEIDPCAELFCVGCAALQPTLAVSTAEPPAAPPPSLPLVSPLPGTNAADRFATSFVLASCAWPTASPTIVPWS